MALATALAQQQLWTEAERVSTSISDEVERAKALMALATALAKKDLGAEAERFCAKAARKSKRNTEDDAQVKALMALVTSLAVHQHYEHLIRLVHHWWQHVERRSKAVRLLSLAYSLIPFYPDLAMALNDAFFWVDAFLRGEQFR